MKRIRIIRKIAARRIADHDLRKNDRAPKLREPLATPVKEAP